MDIIILYTQMINGYNLMINSKTEKHGNFNFSKVTIYLVGGAVRDKFMNIEPKDKDYVVVGSSPQEMIELGFEQVGADFPVFLHPITKDEYALARTERKNAPGTLGFDCEWKGVTIEEDLSRRDLTINSMAIDDTNDIGKVIDPFNGKDDIKRKVLKHTTKAFSEDPLRVLRLARFLARFGESWFIDNDTHALILEIFESGELNNLTPDRVWKETEKALQEPRPDLYFLALSNLGLFTDHDDGYYVPQNIEHHPENYVGVHIDLVMKYAVKTYNDSLITFAAFTHDFGKHITYKERGNFHGHEAEGKQPILDFCEKYKVPNEYRDFAVLVAVYHSKIHSSLGRNTNAGMTPKKILQLFMDCKALQKPERFEKILKACICDARGRGRDKAQQQEFENLEYPQYNYLLECLKAVQETDTKSISKEMLDKGKSGPAIGEAIKVARIASIKSVYLDYKNKE